MTPTLVKNALTVFAVLSTLAGLFYLTVGGRPSYGVTLMVFAALEWWMVVQLSNKK